MTMILLLTLLATTGCNKPSSQESPCSYELAVFNASNTRCPIDGTIEIVIPGKSDFDRGQFSGDRWEYDPGPPANSGWSELFAEVPNFRAVAHDLGAEWLQIDPQSGLSKLELVNAELLAAEQPEIPEYTLTGDKFRYTMGPLFYRGRLDGSARVMVVGQEGATDEALVHRAFVGGAGQKMQNFLNAIGITRSYVFVNTFVYSIFEQFDEFTRELADSGPIKEHRNRIFAKLWNENRLELIISVGAAAHNSVQIFIDEKLGGQLPYDVKWVKVLHPGAAAFGYSDDQAPGSQPTNPEVINAVVESFGRAWSYIWSRKRSLGWLPSDSDGWTWQGSKFYYGDMDIPWRDLPHGIQYYIGRQGTMTERDGALRVALRSSNGVRYEVPVLGTKSTVSRKYSGYTTNRDDEVAWEPAKYNADNAFDRGPGETWSKLLLTSPEQLTVATEAGVTTDTDFDRPVWHRGKLAGAKVLVLAQNWSFDAFVAGRTLMGDNGQKLQSFLERIGITDDYVVITPYPFPPRNLTDENVRALANTATLKAFRDQLITKILAENQIELVIQVDDLGRAAFDASRSAFQGQTIDLGDPRDRAVYSQWNEVLESIGGLSFVPSRISLFEGGKSGFNNVRAAIPRSHIPFGKPLWFGTTSDLSEHPDKAWLFWNAPRWITSEPFGQDAPPSDVTTPDAVNDADVTATDTNGDTIVEPDLDAPDQLTPNDVSDPGDLTAPAPVKVWINELHYDNNSSDLNEGIEIAGPAGTALEGWSLVAYNGSTGVPYKTFPLSGTLANQQNGYGTLWFSTPGLQNGEPDGVALVSPQNAVVQFLSYEGTFLATEGPAAGMESTDIGVTESPTGNALLSLQLTGNGTSYSAFTWTSGLNASPNAPNPGQTFGVVVESDAQSDLTDVTDDTTTATDTDPADLSGGDDTADTTIDDTGDNSVEDTGDIDNTSEITLGDAGDIDNASDLAGVDGAPGPDTTATPDLEIDASLSTVSVWINEIHYDNSSTDENEGVEIAGTAGLNLTGYQLVPYDGNRKAPSSRANAVTLSETIPNQQNGFGTIWVPIAGLENGPDGIALVDPQGSVVQFLSWEGSFTAAEGPASGMLSEDVGVLEKDSSSIGKSLQLIGSGRSYEDFSWSGPLDATRDAPNTGQIFTAP